MDSDASNAYKLSGIALYFKKLLLSVLNPPRGRPAMGGGVHRIWKRRNILAKDSELGSISNLFILHNSHIY